MGLGAIGSCHLHRLRLLLECQGEFPLPGHDNLRQEPPGTEEAGPVLAEVGADFKWAERWEEGERLRANDGHMGCVAGSRKPREVRLLLGVQVGRGETGPSDFSILRFILFNKPWCQAYPALAGVGVAKVLAHGSLGKR